MTHKFLKQEAIKLRKNGYSYNLIAKLLGVPKSTLSDWLSEISYVPNDEVVRRIGLAVASAGERMAEKKRNSINEAHALARKDIGVMTERDLFMLGIGLYIGEGAKSTSIIRVTNSDPSIIAFAIRWFKSSCGLKITNFSIRLHLYPDNDVHACLRHWSKLTGLPIGQFHQTYIDRRINKKMAKRGKLPYGTAHLSVRSKGNILHGSFLRRRIDGWIRFVLSSEASSNAGVI